MNAAGSVGSPGPASSHPAAGSSPGTASTASGNATTSGGPARSGPAAKSSPGNGSGGASGAFPGPGASAGAGTAGPGGAPGAGPNSAPGPGAPNTPAPGSQNQTAAQKTVAFATPAPHPAATGALGNLNRSLNALIPQNSVDYSKTHGGNDIRGAISRAEEEAYAVAAPPPEIVKKAWRILHLSGGIIGRPAGVFYITHRVKLFGKEYCDGWLIGQPSPGAPPTGSTYTFGPCDGDEFSPQGGLPTLPPSNHDPDAAKP